MTVTMNDTKCNCFIPCNEAKTDDPIYGMTGYDWLLFIAILMTLDDIKKRG